MNENRKRGTSNNKILTAIAIASLFIGSSKIMAIETYSENSFGVTEHHVKNRSMKQKVSVPFMLQGILFNVCLIAANLLET